MHKPNAALLLLIVSILFQSTVYSQWTKCNGPYGGTISTVFIDGDTVYTSVIDKGIFVSSNKGVSWAHPSTNIITCNSFMRVNNKILAATSNLGIYYSTNRGDNWIYSGLYGKNVTSLTKNDNFIFAGTSSTYDGNIYSSSNQGASWNSIFNAIPCNSILAIDSHIVAHETYYDYVYFSVNNGANWTRSNNYSLDVSNFTKVGNIFFASTSSGVSKSTNYGLDWVSAGLIGNNVNFVNSENNYIIAGTNYNGVYYSTNLGGNWSQLLQGVSVNSVAVNSNFIYAGSKGYGFYMSSDFGTYWFQTGFNYQGIFSLVSKNNYYFAGGNTDIFISSDNGMNWTQKYPVGKKIISIVTKGDSLFAAATDRILLTTNQGANWFTKNAPNNEINGFGIKDSYLFAGNSFGFYKSTDFGSNWFEISVTAVGDIAITSCMNNVIVGSWAGIYLSSNNGSTWVQTTGGNAFVHNFATYGNNVYAATMSGVYRSSNGGFIWSRIGFANNDIITVGAANNYIFASLWDSGFCVTTNNGINWIKKNEGFTGIQRIYSIYSDNNYVFTGTDSNSIWIRNLNDIVNVKNINSDVPNDFLLHQNYPNPFNPVTKIEYRIKITDFVSLIIYDVNGREVEILVNEKQSPGKYEVSWNASAYPSGVYFYKIQTGDYSETKKMILIK